MTVPIQSATQLRQQLDTLARVTATLSPTSTLGGKIRQLSSQRSADPLQQLQSDAIVDLYSAVRQIQEAIWPLLSTLPDVSGAREAAQAAAAAAGSASSMVSSAMSKSATALTPRRF